MSDDNVVQFKMAPAPGLMSDSMIHRLSDMDSMLLNAETILGNKPLSIPQPPTTLEHPLAEKLFRQFKAGSQIMTKTDAYQIGNELNSLLAQTYELHHEMAAKIAEARDTVARLLKQIEQLSRP